MNMILETQQWKDMISALGSLSPEGIPQKYTGNQDQYSKCCERVIIREPGESGEASQEW